MGDSEAPANRDQSDREEGSTPGGLPPEKVEDRPSVGTVKPEDYPEDLPDH